jgi:hypothetical protein
MPETTLTLRQSRLFPSSQGLFAPFMRNFFPKKIFNGLSFSNPYFFRSVPLEDLNWSWMGPELVTNPSCSGLNLSWIMLNPSWQTLNWTWTQPNRSWMGVEWVMNRHAEVRPRPWQVHHQTDLVLNFSCALNRFWMIPKPRTHSEWQLFQSLVKSVQIVKHCVSELAPCINWPLVQKPNSWTYNHVEVSEHNLESYQTLGFCMDFLKHREGAMVFYQVFHLTPLQNCKRLREFEYKFQAKL